MAYTIRSLKKINFRKSKNKDEDLNCNKVFVFIIILCAIVIVVDYALVIKFIDIIKNI